MQILRISSYMRFKKPAFLAGIAGAEDDFDVGDDMSKNCKIIYLERC
jgi:hypothetical protein